MNKKINFLAIGDIVIDAFIKLQDAWIENDNKEKRDELCMNFGDKIPYEKVDVVFAVGNSPNAAVSASRLGLNSTLLTNIGDDRNGEDCLSSLEKNGIITDFVKKHSGEKTNYHYVLSFQAERTILIKHTEFNYSIPENIDEPEWIYLSSLAENSLPFHKEIAKYLEDHPNVKLAFQPGTFQIKLGYEKIKEIYENSELFFCNIQEAERILQKNNLEIKDLLKEMRELGPKIVIITDGPNGAYVYDGKEFYWGPMYPDLKKPVDRTGAGDSFSSTFTVAIAKGKSIEQALKWGPINSMSVVQFVGAQEGLLSMEKLEKYLEEAPENYKTKKI